MPSIGDRQRLREFGRYTANLSIHAPDVTSVFVCPVCARPFRESDVLHTQLKVDIGHIYPLEAGGKLVTLECCECNRRLNRVADNELVRLHKMWDAMRPGSGAKPIKGYLEMPSGRVGVDVSSFGLHGDLTRGKPNAVDEAIRALIEHRPFRVSWEGVRRGRVNLAILHSAHLFLFRAFGYGYLFTPGGQAIRRVLHSSNDLEDCPFMTMDIPVGGDVDLGIVYRAGVCTIAEGEKCLFVALPVADPSSLCQCVLLPGPWRKDLQAYQMIVERGDRWLFRAQYRTIDGGPRQRLTAPEYFNCFHLLWRGWTQFNIDMTKLMYAIRDKVGDRLDRKADAAEIAQRFGIKEQYLIECIESLGGRGFLERAPKRERPYLVRLTAKALAARRPYSRRSA